MGLVGYTAVHLAEALEYLEEFGEETKILAGGTDLLVRYQGRLDELGRILDINELSELKSIKLVGDQIEIGSLVIHSQLEESEIIHKHVPFLAEAAASVGAPQIRNRGTIGGNIANASPAGDLLPSLVVLDAQVKLQSRSRGEVLLPLAEFLVGPGQNQAQPDELITGVIFSIPKKGQQGAFVKLGQRKALAIAVVNGAVLLELGAEGRVESCRIVVGAVAPTPLRAVQTEQALLGNVLTESLLNRSLELLDQEIQPISDLRGSREYRFVTARELIAQGIRKIWHGVQKGSEGGGRSV